MPSLSIVKMDFKKGAKWGGIALGILIALFVVIKVLLVIKEAILPSGPPPPTLSFGKLPAIYFPDGIKKNFTYDIDTITGELPILPPSAPAYKMEQKGPDILAAQKASDKVSELGFNPHPEQISDFVYKWTNASPPVQNLILNTKLSEFNLSSSFLNYESQIKTKNFTDKSAPIEGAESFLKTIDFYPADVDVEKTQVEFAALNNGVIFPTTRIVTSNIATVYFFQKDRNKIPVVYPEGNKSTMKIVISGGNLMGKVIEGKFSHQNILENSATYPIKSATEAVEELKNNKAFVASHNGDDTHVLIKKVYLGLYYEGRIQKYLSPVIVVEGNNGFIAYIPAIKDEWIGK